MKIVIIAGSHREKAQSYKVAKYLQHQLNDMAAVTAVDIIDLGGNPIPLWDDTFWVKDSALREHLDPYMKLLKGADAFVVIAPEWHGMVPAGLKNFMLYWSQAETGHKPTLIVGVSASINGAYPISELRHSGYKNSKICYIPEHLIVRNVADVMNDMDPAGGTGFDAEIRARSAYTLKMLISYAGALKPMRENNPDLFDKKYTNGM